MDYAGFLFVILELYDYDLDLIHFERDWTRLGFGFFWRDFYQHPVNNTGGITKRLEE